MKLLTLESTATEMGSSRRFVERLIASKQLESVKVGRSRLVSEKAIAAYLDGHTVKALR